MVSSKCECEQNTCHGRGVCTDNAVDMVLTIFGPFHMCDNCLHNLPSEYHKQECHCMKCEGA